VPVASIATTDLRAELNHHHDGEDSRITIEWQRERCHNIEDRNLKREFHSLVLARDVPAVPVACPPSSPRLSRGCMVLAPHLHMVV
jgi:hypothetical protein